MKTYALVLCRLMHMANHHMQLYTDNRILQLDKA